MRPVFNVSGRFPQKPRATGMLLGGAGGYLTPDFAFDFLQSPNPIIGGGTTTTTIDADGSYINSAGTRVQKTANEWPLDHNPATLVVRGRPVELAATNLLLNSLLDGTNLSTQSVTLAAVAHTLAFEGTGTVTLSGASTAGPLVGTGANNRVQLTFTPSAGSVTFTVSGQVRFAQLEATNYATTFIPTAGAAVTRSADVPQIALPAGFNAAEGTVVCEWLAGDGADSISSAVWAITDGTTNERIAQYTTPSQHGFLVTDGGVAQANIITSVLTAGNIYRTVSTYRANDFAMIANGVNPGTDTSGTLPAVTTLYLGNQNGATQGNLWLRKFAYYRRAQYGDALTRLSRIF